ncbi:serine/threonine-protein kinase [Paenibacillus graminis]|uniref:serine/threonine protein kinase n=1 Tax=Paenibacillus graminis TaxID=189425 RepID=UPI002DBE7011|nr:serine/threonine-protein kinase [Paenibacillus graminis]MEC0169463.1 serine/threonine-protein kinase [Paenibacillus graminis]
MRFATKLKAGLILGDRYRIARKIGIGGMSHVFLAEDLRLPGKCWAVKESIDREEANGDIQAEAELLISLNHPLLPGMVDFFPPDGEGYCYLVMDYIEGVTLSEYLLANPGPLPAICILRYAKQLLNVLQYLHGHHPPIVHRDMKPGNIMLTGRDELMLIDLGIARRLKKVGNEDTEKLGTAGFAAPEQYGGGQSGPVSDLYGLGALLLYMATGGQFSRWQPGLEDKLRPGLPDALIPVIRRLLRQHPEERYPNAEAVLRALETIEAQAGTTSGPQYRRSPSAAHPAKRKAAVVALLGTAPGLGTTHTSLAAVTFLSRSGAAAWVDYHPASAVYERICNLLGRPEEAHDHGAGGSPVVWKGVHYYKRPPEGDISSLLRGTYRFVILDLGTAGYAGAVEEFAASDIPLLVASGADWRLEDTLHWLARSGLVPQPNWRVCLPLSGQAAAGLLGAALGGVTVHTLPYQQDPFQQKGKLAETLERLLKEYTPERMFAKRNGIFRKK